MSGPPPPYPGSPVVYAYQPEPVFVAPPGSCPVCGGYVTMSYDRTCLLLVIVFGIFFLPAFLGLLCLEKVPTCVRCGWGGGMY